MSVMRLGYIHVRVTDLNQAREHYSNTLGMDLAAEADGRTYYKAWDEYDHHSVVLEEGGVGLVKFGYKVSQADDLDRYEQRCEQFGCHVDRMSAGDNLGVGDGVRITLPSEHTLELYHDMEYVGTETGTLNPDPEPRYPRGVAVPHLDHAVVSTEEPELLERFFAECLEFRPAERVVTDPSKPELLASFMFCSNTPHDVAFVKGPNGKLHHFAYHLQDWSKILRAGDVFAMDDVPVDVGPTRHGITRGTTIYFFDPSGNRNEVFAGGYTTYPDFPTITWTADQIAKGIFYIGREMKEEFLSTLT